MCWCTVTLALGTAHGLDDELRKREAVGTNASWQRHIVVDVWIRLPRYGHALIFLLHANLIKSQFHHVEHQNVFFVISSLSRPWNPVFLDFIEPE